MFKVLIFNCVTDIVREHCELIRLLFDLFCIFHNYSENRVMQIDKRSYRQMSVKLDKSL